MGIFAGFTDRVADRIARWAVAKTASRVYKLTDPVLKKIFAVSTDGELSDPYSQLAAVYACVNAKARNIAAVPFDLFLEGGDEPVTSGSVVELFRQPNPWMSNSQLWEALVISLEICGEWFLAMDKEIDRNGVPAYLWCWNPEEMQPAKASKCVPVGWWHTVTGTREFVERENVLFDKYWNPRDQIRGLSPIRAARLTAETGYDAMRYNRQFFKNDATPPIVFKWTEFLSDVQFKEEQQRLVNLRQGVERAHAPLLLDGGGAIEQLGLNQKDMEFLGQLKNVRDEMCMIFQVPKSVISLYEDTNYATAQSADLSFWVRSLVPIMTRIEDTLNAGLLNPLGYRGKFNLRKVDAINNAFLTKVDSAVKLFGLGFTANEINERFDLGFREEPWRDEPGAAGVPPSPVPPAKSAFAGTASTAPAVPSVPRDVTPRPELLEDAVGKASRERTWQALNAKVMPVTGKCARDVRDYYADVDGRLFRRMLKGAGRLAEGPRALRPEFRKLDVIDEGELAAMFSDDKLRRVLDKWVTVAMTTGGSTIVGSAFDAASEEALSAIARHSSKVVEINETARQKLIEIIRSTMKDVIDQGLSEIDAADLLTKNVHAVFDQFDHHARTVARTEVHGAYAEGRQAAMASTGPIAKRWISARDARVRDSHRELDGQVVKWNEAFSNGLQYPMDPAGPPEEVINCRCVHVPVYEGEAR